MLKPTADHSTGDYVIYWQVLLFAWTWCELEDESSIIRICWLHRHALLAEVHQETSSNLHNNPKHYLIQSIGKCPSVFHLTLLKKYFKLSKTFQKCLKFSKIFYNFILDAVKIISYFGHLLLSSQLKLKTLWTYVIVSKLLWLTSSLLCIIKFPPCVKKYNLSHFEAINACLLQERHQNYWCYFL